MFILWITIGCAAGYTAACMMFAAKTSDDQHKMMLMKRSIIEVLEWYKKGMPQMEFPRRTLNNAIRED